MNRVLRCITTALVAAALAPPASGQTIAKWRRWEATITASQDYYAAGAGNPYRDLIVRVRFTEQDTGATFVQDAYWTGNTAGMTQFKVRGMFPPPDTPPDSDWAWDVESCAGSTGGSNCATDTTLLNAAGTFKVSNTGSTIKLYDRGALTQFVAFFPGGSTYSQLLYWNGTNFFWGGDTAWAAPPREIEGQTSEWLDYLDDRRGKGFTVVQVAPAPAWPAEGARPALPQPSASFTQVGSCSAPIPNDCSRPKPSYWNAFDNLVKEANDYDLVVAIVGVLDPVVLGKIQQGGASTYPNQANAVDFARYLAARMAGSHVVFSPGFDTWVTHYTQNGTPMQTVMNAVGNALVTAAPLHLVTNHLAGQSTCTHYQMFQNSGWMTFHLFQSGHAGPFNGVAGTVCPGRLSGESSQRAALRRAREMPLTLRGYTNPKMPNINGEALYDDETTTEPDTRYRVRQAGHVSMLSGAKGFTYGAKRIWGWYDLDVNPLPFDLASASDMQRLVTRFLNRPNLVPRHDLIQNQTPDPNHENKMVLASDNSTLLVAYLPGGATSIRINTTPFANLTCTGTQWTKRWYNPPDNVQNMQSINCAQGAGYITLTRPPTCGNTDCDWVLELVKVG